MKDSKTVLKEARDAIKNKNYEQSLKLCKQVLKEDKTNYTALVFLGVSYQETGQPQKAKSAFKDAINLQPTNPLAWNGLVNYYEKSCDEETKKALVESYIALLKIEVAEKKLYEYAEKLCNLKSFGEADQIIKALHYLVKSNKCADNLNLWVLLADFISKNKELCTDYIEIFEEALNVVLSNQKTICTEYYGEYLNLLYKQNKLETLFENAKKMHSLFETDAISLRWICKVFNEFFVESNDSKLLEQPDVMLIYAEDLLKRENNSPTALFTKSILLLHENKVIETKDLLIQVVKSLSGLLHAWILLLKICIKLSLYDEAVLAASKVDKLLKSANDSKKLLRNELDVLIMEALANSSENDDLKRVLDLYDGIDKELKINCLPHVIRANISLGNFVEAKLLLNELKKEPQFDFTAKLLHAQLLRKQSNYDEALDYLNKENRDESEWWIEIGLVYWDLNKRDKCLIPFLKAAKQDPNNFKCFFYLGRYYQEFQDFDKARRCYEKAFKLNNKCTEAGIELSKIYRHLKNWDANLVLLHSLTGGVINKKNSWAWMQLGLTYLDQGDCINAINNLRCVIRIEEENVHCWESLADAYLVKGAYTSALKCYEKASELSQSSLYPLLQMANVKFIVGEYVDARADFQAILSSNKFYVPALKGIAETCLAQAKECYKEQRLGAARDHIQFAADKLILAIKQRSDLSCLWKLLADSCYFATKLPQQHCCLFLPSSISDANDNNNKIYEKDDLFNLAAKSFCTSLNLCEDNILIWHDLAACYLSHAIYTNSKELMERALAAAQYCTNKNPTYWQHWNLLANVAVHTDPPNYRLAQHALIKSVIADNNSAVSWSNLGTLYLILGDLKLANKAFSQAQRADPNYVNSWIGQAFLAESLAHEDDAMDLFRHSTQLGMHQQGAIGYAHWVCKTLKKNPIDAVIYAIHNMHAIPVACDSLTWYTERNPLDSAAWNMLGILRERLGLKLGALEAFKNALALSDEDRKDLARINYGRLLTKHEKYPEAVEMFTRVKAATFNSGSGLALSLFKVGHYKESYEAYESALHWLTDDQTLQSDLLVALASMAYMFDGAESAKTLLFQSINLENPSPWGFFATLSLGLLHKDTNLAELVYNELSKLKNKKDCLGNISILTAYLYLLKGEPLKSIREVSKIIHRYPDQASVWLTLSSLLIRLQRQRPPSKAAARCAQIAMKLGQTNMDVTKVLCLVSLASFITGDMKNALLMGQKAVHCYPNIAEAWAVLSSALLVTKKMPKLQVVKDILKLVEDLSKSKVLNEWAKSTVRLI